MSLLDALLLDPAPFSSDGGRVAVAEGNSMFRCTDGGSYHDTWSTKDQTDRNNYGSDVLVGPRQSIRGLNDTGATYYPQQAASVSVSGTTVTFTTTNDHGFVKGQGVYITPQLGFPAKSYFAVTETPGNDPKKFEIEVADASPLAPSYTFAGLWQVGLAIRENNVIELGQVSPLTRTYAPPNGMVFFTGSHEDQFLFRQVVVRENTICLLPRSQNYRALAAEFKNVEAGLIENNVMDVINASPYSIAFGNPLHFFSNQKWNGDVTEPATGVKTNGVNDLILDALTMAL